MGEIEKFIIMEDDIARDGGRYPEYTYTFLIGLQSFSEGIARGYVKSFHVEKLLYFQGLDQMIFIMEDIMDAVGAPMRGRVPRSLTGKRNKDAVTVPFVDLRGKIKKEYGFEREVLREFPVYPAASVRVVGRQDAGIQGINMGMWDSGAVWNLCVCCTSFLRKCAKAISRAVAPALFLF